jgi:hypothetical protein
MALLMFVTPVCFSGLVLDLFWLLNKVVKVLELCAPLAMANLDRYPLFCAFWHIIMQNGLRFILPSLILNLITNYVTLDGDAMYFNLALLG